MSVYDYIARSNPRLAENIINSFGYEVVDRQDLGKSLKELVANVGEPALSKIMENHPDRDVIMEVNKPKAFKLEETTIEQTNQSCGCWKCKNQSANYLNASGNEASTKEIAPSNTLAQQTNLIVFISAGLIALALVINKK